MLGMRSLDDRRTWVAALAVIGLAALAVRVLVALKFNQPPTLVNDAGWYDFFGRSIASGNGYSVPTGEPTSTWPPGYPYFLGAVYWATGNSQLAARMVQATLGAGTAVLAALLVSRIGDRRGGVVTGALTALFPSLVLYTSLLMSETLFTFLLLAALLLATYPKSPVAMAAAGVVLSLATLVRAQAIVLAPVMLLWAWHADEGSGVFLRRAVLPFGIAMVLALIPWTVRNELRLGTFQPISTNLGLNLWIGNNANADGSFTVVGAERFERAVAGLPRPESEVRYNDLARREALDYMASNPGRVVALAPIKVWASYRNDRSFAAWYGPGQRNLSDGSRTALGRISDYYYYAVLLAACAGAAAGLRRGNRRAVGMWRA